MPLLSPTRVGLFRPSTIMGKYDKIFDSMDEEEDLAKCLVMLSNRKNENEEEDKGKEVVVKGMFQCKACKKVSKSHQALKGHRASHKKVKGCFASRFDNTDDNNEDIDVEKDVLVQANLSLLIHNLNQTSLETSRKSKMHECSVSLDTFATFATPPSKTKLLLGLPLLNRPISVNTASRPRYLCYLCYTSLQPPPPSAKSWSIYTHYEITSKYKILYRVGSGAYSDVYRAR
ncbi:hypothetical protein TEA_006395 [Camellia sinensis var. sinensis]|uniref:C2H2-type domain-containing protein n=1 Tax=Camellia sinensis var. sinensis TaxID=542762 RepID=A0A4S4EK48_CAMSN|nr:hypothetical protein TEA_006395 [Camellia sinensis var. sinensis]